jgi:lysophospholipase L1-like esterase
VAEAAEVQGLSPECRVPRPRLYAPVAMPGVRRAAREDRTLRVLVIGASTGGSSFSTTASYPDRLKAELGRAFEGVEVEVVPRALSGEVGEGAAGLVRSATAEIGPDLVVWQVGTHDALARVALDAFTETLDETLAWLKSHEIDVLLVDPPFIASLGEDEHYASVVAAVGVSARKGGVPLVLRNDAMRHLSARARQAPGGFALNALGKRCLAEHVARTVAAGVTLAEAPGATNAISRRP